MGGITTGVGLISGIDTASLIEQLIAVESRPRLQMQARVARLQAEQGAFSQIASKLSALKSVAANLSEASTFNGANATSSLPNILGVTASKTAQPGSYTFIVKQLVKNSQKISQGFATSNVTPVGVTNLSVELGRSGLASNTDLERLNGGAGVDRGKIRITDAAGGEADIDLNDAVSLNEVISRINAATDVDVTAGVSGDRLVITDNSSGGGTFEISDLNGSTMAADLGVATADNGAGDNDATAGVILGAVVNTVGGSTAVKSLNGGLGVGVKSGVYDLRFTVGGDTFEVDLGPQRPPIDADTLLSELNNGTGVKINPTSENPDFQVWTSDLDPDDDEPYEISLAGAETVQDVINRVSSQTDGKVTLAVNANGDGFVATDGSGGSTTEFRFEGAGPNGEETLNDLGLNAADENDDDVIEGEQITMPVSVSSTQTLQEVIDRINDAEDTTGAANAGRISAAINAAGDGLEITTNTGLDFTVAGGPGLAVGDNAAADLGIEGASVAAVLTGGRLIETLNSSLVRNLNGGSGLTGTATFQDRDGDSFAIDLTTLTSESTDGYLDEINTLLGANSVDITVGLSSAGTGLAATDASGGSGNLIISGDGADSLGLTTDPAGVAANSFTGTNLQLQYISGATALADLNYGQGVGTGVFRVTDGFGDSAEVSIDSDSVTLLDVIAEINSKGLAINARINDTGDGLLIEEDLSGAGGETPFVPIKVDSVSGTAAEDLKIRGEGTLNETTIDGSYEINLALNASDSLDDIVDAINEAGAPISATIINDGSAGAPFRLAITSDVAGTRGDLLLTSTGADLGFSTLTKAQDAKVFFGSENPDDAFLITSDTNTITDIVDGVTINLLASSQDPVEVSIERTNDEAVGVILGFVTAFNDAIATIDEFDNYDIDTEERGLLLGDGTTSRVRSALFNLLFRDAENLSTQYDSLRDVGLTVAAEGTIAFDEDKFRDALDSDRQAVINLFTAEDEDLSFSEEIAPGVTVLSSSTTSTVRGFGKIIEDLLDGFTNSINGTFKTIDESIQTRIDVANQRIEDFNERMENRRQQLQRQFLAMETAIAQLQTQSSALASLSSATALAG